MVVCSHCSKELVDAAGRGNRGFRCSACHNVSYCNRECQSAGWPVHKKACGEASLLSEAQLAAPTLVGDTSHWRVEDLKLQSARGDVYARLALGACYQHGVGGVGVDLVEGAQWYKTAVYSRAPPVASYHHLALCYRYGHGVGQDMVEAVRLWRLGAKAGDTNAMCSLGLCLQRGDGADMNPEEGYSWLRRAGEAGHPLAQTNTGQALLNGFGVGRDPVLGALWFLAAANQGEPQAMYNLGCCFVRGDGVPKSFPMCFAWLRKAAAKGHTAAINRLQECVPPEEGGGEPMEGEGVSYTSV